MPEPIERQSARVLPVNRDGQVLLLFGHDPARPSSPYWFTIGGAVESGETLTDAAARELFEETGICVDPDQLSAPVHRGTHAFSFDGVDYINHSTFFMAAVDDVELTFDGLEEGEIGNIFEARWWDPQDLTDGVSLSSREIPDIARAAVAVRAESP